MKNLVIRFSLIVVGIIALCTVSIDRVYGAEPNIMDLINESKMEVSESDKPKSAILIDANTGKYLWGENPDDPHNPASIMKLMVLYLVYEAMAEGKFDLDTKVTATERHQQIANIYEISNNAIVQGVAYPVKELIPMALVPSSNVATMMLAELVEPDATVFLKKMNEKAKELGMEHTTIYNATGAEISSFQGLYASEGVDTSSLNMEGSNVTTARDFSIFTYHLLKNYPEILDYTKTPTVTVMKGTPNEETFETYNYSLPTLEYAYEGVDGLKTGSSPSGAFNIDTTAKRGDLRLITVVFGVGDWSDQSGEYKRHPFSNAILDYGFKNFEYKEILKPGEQKINDQDVIVEEELKDVVKKGITPTIELGAEGKLGLTNNLSTVSSSISPIESKYKIVEKSVKDKTVDKTKSFMDQVKEQVSGVDVTNPIVKWTIIILGGLVLLIIILIVVLIVGSKRRKKARPNRRKRSQ